MRTKMFQEVEVLHALHMIQKSSEEHPVKFGELLPSSSMDSKHLFIEMLSSKDRSNFVNYEWDTNIYKQHVISKRCGMYFTKAHALPKHLRASMPISELAKEITEVLNSILKERTRVMGQHISEAKKAAKKTPAENLYEARTKELVETSTEEVRIESNPLDSMTLTEIAQYIKQKLAATSVSITFTI